ncbi:MAG: amidohydrolase [Candidatus Bathyarchaeota archaeon]|nr:amidohydrolase [Candidatus Bathyarchaeota archaeon]
MNAEKLVALDWLNENAAEMYAMSDQLFKWAEPGLREYKSSKHLADYMLRQGFNVEMGVSEMPTAFTSMWGEDGPVIGLFAEYDATPGHSQKPVPYDDPEVPYAPGFTDAHNMLGVASCLAAAALKHVSKEKDLKVRIRLLGTPAEKLCVGKPYMARDGYFDGMDTLLAWHPGGPTTVLHEVWPRTYKSMVFNFKVKAVAEGQSGAVTYPGALDAAVLMYNNVNMMKEHMPALMRRGGSINEFIMTGGQCTVANPAFSQIVYAWRNSNLEDQEAVGSVIERCAKGAALVADCDVEARVLTAVRTGLPNTVMKDVMWRNLMTIGAPAYTEEDKEFARAIQRTLGMKPMEEPLYTEIVPPEKAYGDFHPADDVNEFTWHCPTARLYVSKAMTPAPGVRYPRWASSALCGVGVTHRMGMCAAQVMTLSAVELLQNPQLLKDANTEFHERKKTHDEPPLLPEGLKPPIELRWPEWVDRPGGEWWIPDG